MVLYKKTAKEGCTRFGFNLTANGEQRKSTKMETKTKVIIGVVVAILAIVIGLLSSSFRRLSTEEGIYRNASTAL